MCGLEVVLDLLHLSVHDAEAFGQHLVGDGWRASEQC